jgi:tetratricopeptide (TPR) repeat protein
MKTAALLSRFGAPCLLVVCLAASPISGRAQTAADASAAKAPSPEQLTQAELLRSYLELRNQLHAAQLAIVNNRVESETAARVQTAAITERLEAIKAAMAVERERHQAETQRLNAEREREQLETQRSLRTVLWVAAAFGGVGLLAVLLTPYLHLRAMNRMTDLTAARPQLGAAPEKDFLALEAGAVSDQAVTQSSKRLMSVIERMEKRIHELEHTAAPPLPAATAAAAPTATTTTTTVTSSPATASVPGPAAAPGPAPATNGTTDHARRGPDGSGQNAWITVLMAKGRSLLSANKAQEAVTCYDEILKLDPHHAEALVKKGAALERMNRYEEALYCYDRAIDADRRMVLAYLHKGGVCNRLERYDEALHCYELALQAEEKVR